MVNGDPARIEQVVLNLITNALAHASSADRTDVRLRSAGDSAEIEVQDYGTGIPASDLPLIFTRFYQAEGAQPTTSNGLGLGLSICREIVAAHGGTIDVQSIEGQGATFTVRLPLIPA